MMHASEIQEMQTKFLFEDLNKETTLERNTQIGEQY